MNRTKQEWEEVSTYFDADERLANAIEDILELYDELEKLKEIEKRRESAHKPFGGHISGSG